MTSSGEPPPPGISPERIKASSLTAAGDLFKQQIISKFANFTSTQQSIETLSMWMVHHRSKSQRIVNLWLEEIKKEKSTPQRRLLFLYLANDVLQNGRRKGPEYQLSFQPALKDAFKMACTDSEKNQKECLRLLNIWETRSILDHDILFNLKAVIEEIQEFSLEPTNSVTTPETTNETLPGFGKGKGNLSKVDAEVSNLLRSIRQSDSPPPPPPPKDVQDQPVLKKQRTSTSSQRSSKKEGSSKVKHEPTLLENLSSPLLADSASALRLAISADFSETTDSLAATNKLKELLQNLDPERAPSIDVKTRQILADLPSYVSDSSTADSFLPTDTITQLVKQSSPSFLSKDPEASVKLESTKSMLSERVEETEAAHNIAQSYASRLSQESDHRKEVVSLLSSLRQLHTSQLATDQIALKKIKDLSNRVSEFRNNLLHHVSSFPYLPELGGD